MGICFCSSFYIVLKHDSEHLTSVCMTVHRQKINKVKSILKQYHCTGEDMSGNIMFELFGETLSVCSHVNITSQIDSDL